MTETSNAAGRASAPTDFSSAAVAIKYMQPATIPRMCSRVSEYPTSTPARSLVGITEKMPWVTTKLKNMMLPSQQPSERN